MKVCVVVACLALTACGGVVSAERAVTMTDAQVCGEYGDEARDVRKWGIVAGPPDGFMRGARVDPVVSEIKRRDLLSDSQSGRVLSGRVEPGMTDVEALCAWGNPKSIGAPAGDGSSVWTYDAGAFALAAQGTVSLTIRGQKVIDVER